jgi:hypothetical protein
MAIYTATGAAEGEAGGRSVAVGVDQGRCMVRAALRVWAACVRIGGVRLLSRTGAARPGARHHGHGACSEKIRVGKKEEKTKKG